jgi:acid phosphatase family membrane protein YuiD
VQEARLRELLGHTPLEVLVGAAIGLVVGLIL